MKQSVKKINLNDAMGLTDLVLTNNKLSSIFMKSILDALKYDTHLRVLDLRKNHFTTKVLTNHKEFNLIKELQRNEAVTNIDLRENEGFNRQLKFKLSLVMIRNIDILRSKGIMVKGNWFNRNVLMLNETVAGAEKQSKMDIASLERD